MARNCYFSKVGAFVSAAVNLLVGGLSLGGAVYKLITAKSEFIRDRIGIIIIMFLMSLLLIYNGMLLIIGIVMVNKEYVLLYLVLNSISWLGATWAIMKEIMSNVPIGYYIACSILLVVVWCSEFTVYKCYKKMNKVSTCVYDPQEPDTKP